MQWNCEKFSMLSLTPRIYVTSKSGCWDLGIKLGLCSNVVRISFDYSKCRTWLTANHAKMASSANPARTSVEKCLLSAMRLQPTNSDNETATTCGNALSSLVSVLTVAWRYNLGDEERGLVNLQNLRVASHFTTPPPPPPMENSFPPPHRPLLPPMQEKVTSSRRTQQENFAERRPPNDPEV